LTPAEVVAAFTRLGCREVKKHGRKNYRWLERRDSEGRQIAIVNVPTSKSPVRKGLLLAILDSNGIRDEAHMQELLAAADPPGEFLKVLPRGGPRYRPGGQ
jgi:hypothetical protein